MGILIQGYCPIVRGKKEDEPSCVKLKEKYPNKTLAHILLRWAIQQGTVPLPKSDNPDRIKAKCVLFLLLDIIRVLIVCPLLVQRGHLRLRGESPMLSSQD